MDEEKQLVLRHVTTSVARIIEVSKIGAIAFEQRKGRKSEEGHCSVKFIGLPQTEQGEATSSCAWKVDHHCLHGVPNCKTLAHKVFAEADF